MSCCEVIISLPLEKFGRTNLVAGFHLWMTTGCPRKEVALFIRRWIECEVLSLRNRQEQVESLWVRIRHQDNKKNLMAAEPRGAC